MEKSNRFQVLIIGLLALVLMLSIACSDTSTNTHGGEDGDDAADGDGAADGDSAPDGDSEIPIVLDGDETDDCSGICKTGVDTTFCMGDDICVCELGEWTPYDCEDICDVGDTNSKGCGDAGLDYDYCICEEGNADGDEVSDGDEASDGDETTIDPGDVTGYRATELKINTPAAIVAFGYDVKGMLEDQISSRIASGEINLLLIPQTEDVLDFPYTLAFSIGEKVGDGYVAQADESYSLDVIAGSGEREFTTELGTEIAIPFGDGPNEQFVLRDVIVSGKYNAELTTIREGFIAGAVHEDDAKAMVLYQGYTLADVFALLGIPTDYTFPDGSGVGYKFIFTFKAEGAAITVE